MKLNKEQFLEVLDKTPLVSIDLIIKDTKNRILLGKRINEPAKGKWFVPGGRILKGESINIAFIRIFKEELSLNHLLEEARLFGAYSHYYNTNYYLKDGISTHYIVLAYEVVITEQDEINILEQHEIKENEQHDRYKWLTLEDVDPDINKETKYDVHENTLVYFKIPSKMEESQYQILNARRDSFNNLVWQTPIVSLTAQAFLFTIILSKGASELGRTFAAILSLIVALMSLQLFEKHRFMEKKHAEILHAFESINKSYIANRRLLAKGGFVGISSFKLWRFVLWLFLTTAVASIPLIWTKCI